MKSKLTAWNQNDPSQRTKDCFHLCPDHYGTTAAKTRLAAAELKDRWQPVSQVEAKTVKCDGVADAYDIKEALTGVDGVEQLVNMVLHEGARDDNRQSCALVWKLWGLRHVTDSEHYVWDGHPEFYHVQERVVVAGCGCQHLRLLSLDADQILLQQTTKRRCDTPESSSSSGLWYWWYSTVFLFDLSLPHLMTILMQCDNKTSH